MYIYIYIYIYTHSIIIHNANSMFIITQGALEGPDDNPHGPRAGGAWHTRHEAGPRYTIPPMSVSKNTPPEKSTHWSISFQSTKSGADDLCCWTFVSVDFPVVVLSSGSVWRSSEVNSRCETNSNICVRRKRCEQHQTLPQMTSAK